MLLVIRDQVGEQTICSIKAHWIELEQLRIGLNSTSTYVVMLECMMTLKCFVIYW